MIEMAALIEPHIPALRRFALGLVRDQTSADDLVQDCLERAVRGWRARRQDGSVKAWLFTILYNRFVSDRRRDRRRLTTPLDEAPEPAIPPAQAARLDVLDILHAMDLLPEDQRAVLLLVGVEDLSYDETARLLAVPIGTVMSRLSRGRERLRRIMAGESMADRPALRSVQ